MEDYADDINIEELLQDSVDFLEELFRIYDV